MSVFIALVSTFLMFVSVPAQKTVQSASLYRRILSLVCKSQIWTLYKLVWLVWKNNFFSSKCITVSIWVDMSVCVCHCLCLCLLGSLCLSCCLVVLLSLSCCLCLFFFVCLSFDELTLFMPGKRKGVFNPFILKSIFFELSCLWLPGNRIAVILRSLCFSKSVVDLKNS